MALIRSVILVTLAGIASATAPCDGTDAAKLTTDQKPTLENLAALCSDGDLSACASVELSTSCATCLNTYVNLLTYNGQTGGTCFSQYFADHTKCSMSDMDLVFQQNCFNPLCSSSDSSLLGSNPLSTLNTACDSGLNHISLADCATDAGLSATCASCLSNKVAMETFGSTNGEACFENLGTCDQVSAINSYFNTNCYPRLPAPFVASQSVLNAGAVYNAGSTGVMTITLKDQRGDFIPVGSQVPSCLNGVSSDASCFFHVTFSDNAISSPVFSFSNDGDNHVTIRVNFAVAATALGPYSATVYLLKADGTDGSVISGSGASFTVPRIVSKRSTFSVASIPAYGATGSLTISLLDQVGNAIYADNIPNCPSDVVANADCFFAVTFDDDSKINTPVYSLNTGNVEAAITVTFTISSDAVGTYKTTVALKTTGSDTDPISTNPTQDIIVPPVVAKTSTYAVTSPVAYGTTGSLKISLNDQGGNAINADNVPDCRGGVDATADCFFAVTFDDDSKINTPVYALNSGNVQAEITVTFTVSSDAVGTYKATVALKTTGSDTDPISTNPTQDIIVPPVVAKESLFTVTSPGFYSLTGYLTISLKDQGGRTILANDVPNCPTGGAGTASCFFSISFSDNARITVTGVSFATTGSNPATIRANFAVNSDAVGTYYAALSLYNVNGQAGTPLNDASKSITVQPIVSSLSQVISPSSMNAGSSGSLTIRLKDQGGNYINPSLIPACPGGQTNDASCYFSASFGGSPDIIPGSFAFGNDGSNHATITFDFFAAMNAVGGYPASVYLLRADGTNVAHVSASPYTVNVIAFTGSYVAGYSIIDGAETFVAGTTRTLTIMLKDQRDAYITYASIPSCLNRVTNDPSCFFSVSFSGVGISAPTFTFGQDALGRAKITLTFVVASSAVGSYSTTVSLKLADGSNASQIMGSPKSFTVPVILNAASTITGASSLVAGSGTFTINLKDQAGNLVTPDTVPDCLNGVTLDPSCYFNVAFSGVGITFTSFEFSDDGENHATILINFDIAQTAVGSYTATVYFRKKDGTNGSMVTGSPKQFTVPAYVADGSVVSSASSFMRGSSGTLAILLKDEGGNFMTPGGVPACLNGVSDDPSCYFRVAFSGSGISLVNFQFGSNSDNHATIVVNFNVAASAIGSYTATVIHKKADGTDGSAISGSPAQFAVPKIVDSTSVVSGPASIASGTSGTLTIYLKDQTGSLINTGAVPNCPDGSSATASCFFVITPSDNSAITLGAITFGDDGNGHATISASFSVAISAVGSYSIAVYLQTDEGDAGVAISGSSVAFTVPAWVASGSVLSGAASFGRGSTGTLTVLLKDQAGNYVNPNSLPKCFDGTTGTASCYFRVTFSSTDVTLGGYTLSTDGSNHATVIVSFNIGASAIGSYSVFVQLANAGNNGASISASPLVFSVPKMIDVPSTYTVASTFSSGTTGSLTILLRDQTGSYIAPGSIPACLSGTVGVASCYFKVSFSGVGVTSPIYAFGDDGAGHATIGVSFTVGSTAVGSYTITVILNNADNTNGPALTTGSQQTFAVPAFVATTSQVSGPVSVNAGSTATLTIALKDQGGNFMTPGSIPACASGVSGDATCYFDVSFGNADMLVKTIAFGTDGSGNAAIAVGIFAGLNGSGNYLATVKLKNANGSGGSQITSSPLTVPVVATAGSYVASGSVLDVPQFISAGTTRNITITLKNQNGAFIQFSSIPACVSGVTNDPSCHFAVSITGASGIGAPTFAFGKDSSNRARVIVTITAGANAVGTYSVAVVLKKADGSNGAAISGSPKSFSIAAFISSVSTISGASSFEAGSTGSVTVLLKDQGGNMVDATSIPDCLNGGTGDATCYFNAVFSDSAITSPQFSFSDDGSGHATIVVSFNIPTTSVGDFSVSIYLQTVAGSNGALVSGASQAYTVPARVSKESYINAGDTYGIGTHTFTIEIQDQGGNTMGGLPNCPNGDVASASCFFNIYFSDPEISLVSRDITSTGGRFSHTVISVTFRVGSAALGSYTISTMLRTATGQDGSVIGSSPQSFNVPAIVDATSTFSVGNSYNAGSSGSITILLKDQQGGLINTNAIPNCLNGDGNDPSCHFIVSFSPSGITTSTYSFGSDGNGHATIVVPFTVAVDAVGSYTVTIVSRNADNSNGNSLSGSPKTFNVPATVTHKSVVSVPGAISAGTTGSLTISLRDQGNNPIPRNLIPTCSNGVANVASCFFNVAFDQNIFGTATFAFNSADNDYAAVIVSFSVPLNAALSYTANVYSRNSDGSNGAAVTSSPVSFIVPSLVTINSYVDTMNAIRVGPNSRMTIYLLDQAGNYISPSGIPDCPNGGQGSPACFFDISFSDPEVSVADLSFSSVNNKATIVARLNVAKTAYGDYSVAVTMKSGDNSAITASPMSFNVPSFVDSTSSLSLGNTFNAGSTGSLTIVLRDQKNNLIPAGSVPPCLDGKTGDGSCYFHVSYSRPGITTTTYTIGNDGNDHATIVVSFTVAPDAFGSYVVTVVSKMADDSDGLAISGSASTFTVPFIVSYMSTVSAPTSVTAGTSSQLTITLIDQAEHPISFDSVPGCLSNSELASCYFDVTFSKSGITARQYTLSKDGSDQGIIIVDFDVAADVVGDATVNVALKNADGSTGVVLSQTAKVVHIPAIVAATSTYSVTAPVAFASTGSLTISLKDQGGNAIAYDSVPLCPSGQADASCYFAVSFDNAKLYAPQFALTNDDSDNAIISVSFAIASDAVGDYKVNVALKKFDGSTGASLTQNPQQTVTVPAIVAATSTYSAGSIAPFASSGSITIALKDQGGNFINAGSVPKCPKGLSDPDCYFVILFSQSKLAVTGFSLSSDGANHATIVVSFSIDTDAVGDYEVIVSLKNPDDSSGTGVVDSMKTITVPQVVSGLSQVADPSSISAGTSSSLVIVLKDQGGNYISPSSIPACASGALNDATCYFAASFGDNSDIIMGAFGFGTDGSNHATITVGFFAAMNAMGGYSAQVYLKKADGTNGLEVSSSPYTVDVVEYTGSYVASGSVVDGGSFFLAGSTRTLNIMLRDQNGDSINFNSVPPCLNRVTGSASCYFKVTFSGSGISEPTFTLGKDAVNRARIIVTFNVASDAAGAYLATVQLKLADGSVGSDISGSPKPFTVPVLLNSATELTGPSSFVAGPAALTIFPRDQAGNLVGLDEMPDCLNGATYDPTCYFNFEFTGIGIEDPYFEFSDDGEDHTTVVLNFNIASTAVGPYTARVYLQNKDGSNGAMLTGSPKEFIVPAFVADNSVATGPSSVMRGSSGTLTILLKDEGGNLMDPNGVPACLNNVANDPSCYFRVAFSRSGVTLDRFEFGSDENNHATILVHFNVAMTAIGDFTATVILKNAEGTDGSPISSPPVSFNVPKIVDSGSVASGPSSVTSGSTETIVVVLKDQAGNYIDNGAIPACLSGVSGSADCYFSVTFTGSGVTLDNYHFVTHESSYAAISVDFNVADNAVGSFTSTLRLKNADGTSGAALSGSPVTFTVPAWVASGSVLSGPSSLTRGSSGSLTVLLKDQGGNYVDPNVLPKCFNGDAGSASCYFNVAFSSSDITLSGFRMGTDGSNHATVVAEFEVASSAIASYSATVSLANADNSGPQVTASPLSFNVPMAVAATSSFSIASSFSSGSSGSLVITLRDQAGHYIDTNSIPACLSGVVGNAGCYFKASFSGTGISNLAYTFGNDGAGHATVVVGFNVAGNAVGSYTVTVILKNADGSDGPALAMSEKSFVVPAFVASASQVTGPT